MHVNIATGMSTFSVSLSVKLWNEALASMNTLLNFAEKEKEKKDYNTNVVDCIININNSIFENIKKQEKETEIGNESIETKSNIDWHKISNLTSDEFDALMDSSVKDNLISNHTKVLFQILYFVLECDNFF